MKFRLATILLFVLGIALTLANLVAWREAAVAKSELNAIRSDFGVLIGSDPNKTFVRGFRHKDYKVPSLALARPVESSRILPAVASHYSLQVAEIENASFVLPELDRMPDASVLLASLETAEMERVDVVVSCQIKHQGSAPSLFVTMNGDTVIEHGSSQDWSRVTSRAQSTITYGNEERMFAPDEAIPLYYWFSPSAKQGFLVWLAPIKKSEWETEIVKDDADKSFESP